MNILITGASGLIGSALTAALSHAGHTVYPMVRKKSSDQPFHWWPDEGIINLDENIKLDTVINLAGENIAEGRWNEQKKTSILHSRVDSTHLLSTALATSKTPPQLLISGSAIGFYGDTGERTVDENSPPGSDFLSEVSIAWEQATQPAVEAGIRTVLLRTGIVLSPDGGVLQKMLPPFKAGLGGAIGNGEQYMSWVSINDVVGIIRFIIDNDSISGPVNLVSENPVNNSTFSKTLAKVLKRPTLFPLPAFVARTMFGEMADALLLSGARVQPHKLQAAGYRFIDNDLETALRTLLNK